MIQKKTGLNKRQLSIIITSSVLVVLITAYVLLTAILPGIVAAASGSGKKDPPEVNYEIGESLYSNKAVVYPYLDREKITSITVGSHVDKFSMVRPADKSAENKYLDYFIFYYEDENGELTEYFPNISSADVEFDYTDFYAKEESDGLGMYKIDYLCAAISALFYDEKIPLSADASEKEAQLNRYGLGKADRETIIIGYLDSDGKESEHIIHIGDKLITGSGYYFMIGDREYVYASSYSNTLSYALGGFEEFLHSRIIAAELEGDKGAAPYHTKNYSQWTSSYHKVLGELIPAGVEVIVKADCVQPIYEDIKDEESDVVGKNTGYRYSGYRSFSFDLASLGQSLEFTRMIKALVGNTVGEFSEKKAVSVVTDMNQATLYDSKANTGVYEYTIYGIEAILTEDGEISTPGARPGSDGVIKVTYSFKIDGVAPVSEKTHAVIDLTKAAAIPADVKAKLVATGVGELSEPLTFTVKYNSDNVNKRKMEYVITNISFIAEKDEKGNVSYLNKVTEKSVVTYDFHYLLDGKVIGSGDVVTIDLSQVKAGHYLNVKEALVGKTAGVQDISVADDVYCQPFMDFRTYNIDSILGYVQIDETVAFRYLPEGDRDNFRGESMYENILSDTNAYSDYMINDEACDAVLRIVGGISAETGASGAQGVVGSETVAVGLTHENMDKYGLYNGHRISFSLPRGLKTVETTTQGYDWIYDIEFVLYIGERQPDGTRYVGSEMYDIVVKIDASTFDYLEYSFSEFWARRNMVMINVANINRVGVEFSMEELYGKYDLNLKHTTKYYDETGIYNEKVDSEVNYKEYDFIDVRVTPLGDRHSESLLLDIFNGQSDKTIGTNLATVYNVAAGIMPGSGRPGLSVGFDTLGTSSFKDLMKILFSTYYLGVLSEEDQAKATEENRLLRLGFDVEGASTLTYTYDFHRIDDRRVLVSLYRTDSTGHRVGEIRDFYISTFAFKKIVNNFVDLFNGVEIDSEIPY